jgi:hypothetical protein
MLHGLGDERVGELHRTARLIDEACLDVAPSPRQLRRLRLGEEMRVSCASGDVRGFRG